MISFFNRVVPGLVRVYVAIVLIIVITLSPLYLALVSFVLLAWYCFLWWKPNSMANLLTNYFLFFSIVLLITPIASPVFSFLTTLPVLFLVVRSLETVSQSLSSHDTKHLRRPTDIFIALLSIAFSVLGVSVLLGSISLLLTSAAVIALLVSLAAIAFRGLTPGSIGVNQVLQRMVVGREDDIYVTLTADTRTGGLLILKSPYEWLSVSPDVMSLNENILKVKIHLRPTLSGPSVIELDAYAIDRWGLTQIRLKLQPVRLYVIPRAKYAIWLAKRYLKNTKPGTVPLFSTSELLRPIQGVTSEGEYFSPRLYQGGDSLKHIDWKHSLKYNELIIKDYKDSFGQSAIIQINLAVGNAEEADKLAYDIITTSITMARGSIPTSFAVYDHENVKITTLALQPQQLVLQSLLIAERMVSFVDPVKYLNPPDVTRLRANIDRIRLVEGHSSEVLIQLLQMEYANIQFQAKQNPATKALAEAFGKTDKNSNVIVISNRNHDSEALEFARFDLNKKGNTVITI